MTVPTGAPLQGFDSAAIIPRAYALGFPESEGKGQAEGQPLPVVAEGLIPLIYRRAFFKHRATP
jgi:hypothetical protein